MDPSNLRRRHLGKHRLGAQRIYFTYQQSESARCHSTVHHLTSNTGSPTSSTPRQLRSTGWLNTRRQARTLLLERRAAKAFTLVTGTDEAERVPSRLAWADIASCDLAEREARTLRTDGEWPYAEQIHPEWWVDCTIPWITTGEVSQIRDDRREVLTETRERISEIGLANSAAELHPKGTVVLCRTASAGYSAVMGEDMATSQDFVTWTCGPDLDPFYLLWCLRAMRADLLGAPGDGIDA